MYKLFGVILIIVSCGGVGFKIAANHKTEEKYLRDFILILDYMISDLQYRMTPLPILCRQASQLFNSSLSNLLGKFADELETHQCAEPAYYMAIILEKDTKIPPITRCQIESLSNSLGRFDIDGQTKSLNAVKNECERQLAILRDNQSSRLRGYQTLGLCAGAALAILFI